MKKVNFKQSGADKHSTLFSLNRQLREDFLGNPSVQRENLLATYVITDSFVCTAPSIFTIVEVSMFSKNSRRKLKLDTLQIGSSRSQAATNVFKNQVAKKKTRKYESSTIRCFYSFLVSYQGPETQIWCQVLMSYVPNSCAASL